MKKKLIFRQANFRLDGGEPNWKCLCDNKNNSRVYEEDSYFFKRIIFSI